MRLQISKRLFSLTDKYDVLDDGGNPVYQVQGYFFTFGKNLELYYNGGSRTGGI